MLLNSSNPQIRAGKEFHLIPGRLRLVVPNLKRNNLLARHLNDCLAALPGVKSAWANPSTGRALVYFDPIALHWRTLVREIISASQYLDKNLPAVNRLLRDKLSQPSFANDGYAQAAATLSAPAAQTYPAGNKTEKDLPWHVMNAREAVAFLNSNADHGLSGQAVQHNRRLYGANQFIAQSPPSLFSLLLEPFKDFMTRLLLGAAGVSLLLGEFADAAAITTIVGVQAILGAIQGYRAEKSLAALKELNAPHAWAVREGFKTRVLTRDLVPGDIILLETGNKVPADARVLESVNLMVEESSLTGESVPVSKTASPCRHLRPSAADKNNMVFMGTSVTGGRAKAVVVATGMETEMGRIASMLQQVEPEPTLLQKQLEDLGKKVTKGALAVVSFIAAVGIIRGRPLWEMLRTGVSLAVGAIPEGLPAVVTLALAFGVQRMVKKKAVVRKLPAVETLGSATVVCTDKTGTLTKNEMTVKAIYTNGISWEVTGEGYVPEGDFIPRGRSPGSRDKEALHRLLTIGALCNNAQLTPQNSGQWTVSGDPTEVALLSAAAKAGLWRRDLQNRYCRSREIAFDSARKLMTVICQAPEQETHIFTKGAPDNVLACCTRVIINGRVVPLDIRIRNQILSVNNEMSGKALRVLALAYKPLAHDQNINNQSPQRDSVIRNENLADLEKDMIFAGLTGMLDPPRPGVKEAVDKCRRAGIKVVMITGDQQNTARAIAGELNILEPEGILVSGNDIDGMSDADLAVLTDQIQVCSETTPAQKLRIVRAFKSRGYIVAMTGDGVNDAPAVKEADIGLAMGKSGTDVTREAAGITLADDNFTTIEAAVREGRTVGDNIRKSLRYILSGNIGEVLAIFLAAVSGFPTPLVPAQILWVNLASEGFPAMALVADPPEPGCMDRPPGKPEEKLLSQELSRQILRRGLFTGISTFGVFGASLLTGAGLSKARTLAFANLVLSQVFNVFDSRTSIKQVPGKLNSNRYLLPAAALSTGLLFAAIYVPVLQPLFTTVPLNIKDWVILALTSGSVSRV